MQWFVSANLAYKDDIIFKIYALVFKFYGSLFILFHN